MKQLRKIITIDCDYMHPQFAAAYLLIDGGEAMFIDNNTSYAVPKMLKALRSEGLAEDAVRYIAITHVHLDHAGGTSALVEACPNATVLAHPKAARHIIDPSKLVASARAVYGDDTFNKLYGRIQPVPAARLKELSDGQEVSFGDGLPLKIIYTKGHANHHLCLYDQQLKAIFTGDAFGLAYPALQKNLLFVMPSTSPTDFDAAAAFQAVDLILNSGATTAYPTHFGALAQMHHAARQLKDLLEISEKIRQEVVSSSLNSEEATNYCESKLRLALASQVAKLGLLFTSSDWDLLKLDIELNAQGLAWTALKERDRTPS